MTLQVHLVHLFSSLANWLIAKLQISLFLLYFIFTRNVIRPAVYVILDLLYQYQVYFYTVVNKISLFKSAFALEWNWETRTNTVRNGKEKKPIILSKTLYNQLFCLTLIQTKITRLKQIRISRRLNNATICWRHNITAIELITIYW